MFKIGDKVKSTRYEGIGGVITDIHSCIGNGSKYKCTKDELTFGKEGDSVHAYWHADHFIIDND